MRLWHLLITRFRSLFLRRRAERELHEELHLHLERELDRKLAEGVPVEQARRDLHAEFGRLEQIKEECRDARGLGFLEEAIQDARYGARSLRRSPGFLVTVVLTLAMGIGTSTAIFSVVYGVLWKPLPIKASDRVAALWLVPGAGSMAPATAQPASSQRTRTGWQGNLEDGRNTPELAPADFADIREQSRMFEQVAGADPYSFTLSGEGEPVRLRGWRVSRGFFDVAGVGPLLGRAFLPDDHVPGANRIVLLSYRVWQSYFGGDPKIVGTQMRLGDVPSTVVGIMPQGFDLPVGGYYSAVEMWTPLPDDAPSLRGRESTHWPVMARLAPGASWEQAQHELDEIGARLAEQYPQSNAARRFRVIPIREHLVGTLRTALLVLSAAVGLVLLTACANVACLLLMRRSQRRRELAVRLALGASRGRVARQLMMEHAMLAAAGTILGVVLSYGLIPILLALNPATSPLFDEVAVDGAALAFSLVLCVVTAILFGLAPALRFASSESWRGLELGSMSVGESRPAQRMRAALVVSQIALSVALLAGAGLLARTFANLLSVDPGLRTEGILTAQSGFFGLRGDSESVALVRDVSAKMSGLPGVMEAAGVSNLPMHETPVDYRSPCSVEGQPTTPGEPVRRCLATIITEGYFRSMGIALDEGRVFNERDAAGGERVIVINRTMARMWRGASPVGAKVRLTGFPINVNGDTVATVVGVVRDVVHTRPDADAEPEVYMPHAQVPVRSMTFVLRTNTDPATLAAPVRSILREAMPAMPLGQIATMEHFRSESFRPERFNALLLSAFAGSTLLLAAIGLYGVVAYAVTMRLREFALRTALGARRSDIIQGVLLQGLTLAAIGVVLGLGLALVGTRLLSNMLFHVGSSDLGTYAVITGVTLVAACLACLLPARRASRVNPASALRGE